ncbi:hypothetical protein Scep_021122 [Stephania cephalantha]|uniref:Uncharacterized protein n=1 Tax=Stephania cephalantha TaxID=152367 RepID=A0AAP0HWL1_9MAGN
MPRRVVIVLSILFLVINVLGSAYAKEESKTGPEGLQASAASPGKSKAAPGPSVDLADPVISPTDGGSDTKDGPIGETMDTNPDVVPLGPTSSSSSSYSSVAAGPGAAAAPKSAAARALKVPVVAGAASVLGGFFFFFLIA